MIDWVFLKWLAVFAALFFYFAWKARPPSWPTDAEARRYLAKEKAERLIAASGDGKAREDSKERGQEEDLP